MAIPSQEELDAAEVALTQLKPVICKLRDLIAVARRRGSVCNGLIIPLTDDLIQPLIDEYLLVKAEAVALFQELP